MSISFSERYGYKEIKQLRPDEMSDALRKRIWNFFKKCIDGDEFVIRNEYEIEMNTNRVIEIIWDKFFKEDLDNLESELTADFIPFYRIDAIRDKFYNLKWYEVYEFIEFLLSEFSIVHKEDFISGLNKIFKEENAPYRIIENLVVPLTDKTEINEVNRALEVSDKYQPVKYHIKKALEFYSKRPNPDYKKSISESIHAIEALGRIITDKASATLGDLTKEFPIHPALREGLNKIYGWTSDESGIRHAEKQYPAISADDEEARFMLVLVSAFVNYIIAKHETEKTK